MHEVDETLSRCFGLGAALQIDAETVTVEEEDLVPLMSDGVTKVFDAQAAALVAVIYELCWRCRML